MSQCGQKCVLDDRDKCRLKRIVSKNKKILVAKVTTLKRQLLKDFFKVWIYQIAAFFFSNTFSIQTANKPGLLVSD